MRKIICAVLVATAGCGDVVRNEPDADVAEPHDAVVDPGVDASTQPHRDQELAPLGGRASSASYTFDVQLGHGLDRRPLNIEEQP